MLAPGEGRSDPGREEESPVHHEGEPDLTRVPDDQDGRDGVAIPLIRRAEQVCDGCALGKQHRTPFP